MKCPNCGSDVQGDVCASCGHRMEPAPEASANPVPPPVVPAVERDTPTTDPGATAFAGSASVPNSEAQPRPADPPPLGTPGGSGAAREVRMPSAVRVPPSVASRLGPLEAIGKQYVAWIGCLLLLIGLFVSAKTYTVSGFASALNVSTSRSLWDYGTFWAIVLLLLVAASAALAYLRDYQWLLITGAAAFLICILEFLYAFSTGVDVPGLSAHPSWGWILLFPGALLILAAGAMRATDRDRVDEQGLNRVIGGIGSPSARR